MPSFCGLARPYPCDSDRELAAPLLDFSPVSPVENGLWPLQHTAVASWFVGSWSVESTLPWSHDGVPVCIFTNIIHVYQKI